jgi:hypothetical protein
LKQQKSKHARQFRLSIDNETGVNRVYRTVNIKMNSLKLKQVKRGKKQKQFVKMMRKEIERVSLIVHTYSEHNAVIK